MTCTKQYVTNGDSNLIRMCSKNITFYIFMNDVVFTICVVHSFIQCFTRNIQARCKVPPGHTHNSGFPTLNAHRLSL